MNNTLDKTFARKLRIMVDSRLIWYKHYELWCDEIIESLEEPPYWIIELAGAKYFGDALKTIAEFSESEPFEVYSSDLADFYIACLYLRYERREISWATFLLDAGQYADNCQSTLKDCEYFYDFLNIYDDSFYNGRVEKRQRVEIVDLFKNKIVDARTIYNPFESYYRKFLKRRASK